MKFILPSTQTPEQFLQGIAPLRNTWEYKIASIGVLAQLIVGGGAILWFWRRLPPVIPLWYSRPWGEDRLTSPWFLLVPLGASILIYGGNIIAVVKIASGHPMFARVLFLTSLLVSMLSIVLVIRIVTLVS